MRVCQFRHIRIVCRHGRCRPVGYQQNSIPAILKQSDYANQADGPDRRCRLSVQT